MIRTTLRINLVDSVLRMRTDVFSFLSGATLSIAANLYTGVFSDDTLPSRWKQILWASALATLSSVLWAILTWNLSEVKQLLTNASAGGLRPEESWQMLIGHRRRRLALLLASAVISAAAGFVAVALGTRPFSTEEKMERSRTHGDGRDHVEYRTNDVGAARGAVHAVSSGTECDRVGSACADTTDVRRIPPGSIDQPKTDVAPDKDGL